MKKKQKKIIKLGLICLIVFIVIFILSHTTPKTAVKTHLLATGHPIAAFSANVYFNEFQYKLDKKSLDNENSKIYGIDGNSKYRTTGNSISNFKVKKIFFLYFAQFYGEA